MADVVTLTPLPLQLVGAAISASALRYNVGLVGVVDGVNKVFSLPSSAKYVNNLGATVQIMLSGVKQLSGVTPTELGGLGTGFNAVTLTTAPTVGTTVTADYVND